MEAINTSLRDGRASILALAAEFAVTRDSLMRHRDRHLSQTVMVRDPDDLAAERDRHTQRGEERRHWMTRARRRGVPADVRERFLTEYARTGNLQASAVASGVGRRTVYTWQEHDEQFALAFREAEAEAIEALEAEARERATVGGKLVREVWRGDRLVERVIEYRPSDTVLVKLLQALKPDKYGDKLAVTQTQIVKTIDQQAWDSV